MLELALVILSHDELEVTLAETKEFFSQFLSVLITYATEGMYFVLYFCAYEFNVYVYISLQKPSLVVHLVSRETTIENHCIHSTTRVVF